MRAITVYFMILETESGLSEKCGPLEISQVH